MEFFLVPLVENEIWAQKRKVNLPINEKSYKLRLGKDAIYGYNHPNKYVV